jgi:6-phosphogluconolactonase
MLHEVVVDKPDALGDALGEWFAREGRSALSARGRFAVAVPGGSVARVFFPRLARVPFDWSRAELFQCDERAVPPTDPGSNYALARALWLEPARIPLARFHRMEGEAVDLQGAADAYAHVLRRVLGTPPSLDLALLGAGEDGHVCSLFPGHALLRRQRAWVAALADAPKPPPRRLTLTLPALRAAGTIVVAALGEAKAGAVREALEDEASSSPLALVARGARRAVFLLDHAAASRLPPP